MPSSHTGTTPSQTSQPATGPSASPFNYASLKNGLKKYGRTGVVVYLGLSTCVTAGFYFAIERHFDAKKFLGIEEKEDRPPTLFERIVTGKGSSLALAILCSKALVPIKVPVAMAVTPYVQRTWQQIVKPAVSKVT